MFTSGPPIPRTLIVPRPSIRANYSSDVAVHPCPPRRRQGLGKRSKNRIARTIDSWLQRVCSYFDGRHGEIAFAFGDRDRLSPIRLLAVFSRERAADMKFGLTGR